MSTFEPNKKITKSEILIAWSITVVGYFFLAAPVSKELERSLEKKQGVHTSTEAPQPITEIICSATPPINPPILQQPTRTDGCFLQFPRLIS